MKKTTVLIPNYNGIKYLKKCLESIPDYPVLVIDNGSCDGSDMIAEQMEDESDGRIHLIRLPENTGFCHAVNVGLNFMERASGEYAQFGTPFVFLLNNDTTIKKNTIPALEHRMDTDSRIFSVQSRILSMRDPDIIDDCGDLYCALGWAFARGKGEKAYIGEKNPVPNYGACRDIFAGCGAAVMYRMSLFNDVGRFDEAHFAYLEDIDLGYRARIFGFRNVYEPSSVVYHAGSATSGSRHNRFKADLSAQNSVYLVYKNMPVLQIVINLPFLLVGFAVKTVFYATRLMGFTYARGLIRGLRKCAGDMKDGHRHKVWFRPKYIPSYCRIQIELWENLGKGFAGIAFHER